MYHGNMGWTYNDLYNLPVHLRRYFYTKLSDIKKQQYEKEKAEYDKMNSSMRRR
jgi:hypothetical protein